MGSLISNVQKDVPHGTVLLHQFPRASKTPSISPLCLKLETFLRMNKVPYQNLFSYLKQSSKGTVPWIQFDGETVDDSNMCIVVLKNKLELHPDGHLTENEKAQADTIKFMVENSTCPIMQADRWGLNPLSTMVNVVKESGESSPMSWLICAIMARRHNKDTHAQGAGRLSWDELHIIAMQQFNVLSVLLGEKPYMMGDRPSEVDCSVFGVLVQFLHYPEFGLAFIIREFDNLVEYCDRMQVAFWPDWRDLTTKPERPPKRCLSAEERRDFSTTYGGSYGAWMLWSTHPQAGYCI